MEYLLDLRPSITLLGELLDGVPTPPLKRNYVSRLYVYN